MKYHGDEDDLRAAPTQRELGLALIEVIDVVLYYGQWPQKGKSAFDLYEFLLENRDPSYFLEMYVASMSDNTRAFKDRIERERATVTEMLEKHLRNSDLVSDYAAENK
jgi:hypothetical protein